MYRQTYGIALLAILFSVTLLPVEYGLSDTPNEPTLFASRIIAITDVVMDQHIDPPARQQMILTGVKALYVADGRQAPQELGQRVSELATNAQIAKYLDGVLVRAS